MILFHQTRSDKEATKEPLRCPYNEPSHAVLDKRQSVTGSKCRTCAMCGREFAPYRNSQKYCSESCRSKAVYIRRKTEVGKIKKICAMCGKESLIEGYHRNQHQKYQKYCQRCASILAHENRKKTLQTRTCAGCGKTFVSKNPGTRFCSLQCAYEHRSEAHLAKRYCEVVEHIKLCQSKHEFRTRYPSDTTFALKHNIKEYKSWANGKRPIQISDEAIIAESRKYHTKKEFRNRSPNMYAIAARRGLMVNLVWLAAEPPFHERYVVYRYFFKERKAVYVGLSCDPRRRDAAHRKSRGKKTSSVFKFAKLSGLEIPKMEILVSGIAQSEARTKEHEYINQYKEIGYKVLNIGKTGATVGSIGGISKYTKKKFLEVARKVGDFKEFKRKFKGLYIAALKYGWLKECNFLRRDRRAPRTIDDEYAIRETNRKSSIEELRNDSALYNYISKHKLWHRTKFGLPRQSLSKVFCFSVARAFSSTSSLRKFNATVYLKMQKNGWLDECPWLLRGEGRRHAASLRARPVRQMTMDGKVLKIFPSVAVGARTTNVSSGNLTSCLKGRIQSCGGFRWQYAD